VLDNNHDLSDDIRDTDLHDMMELAPYVIEVLRKNDLDNVFLMFFRQVHNKPDSVKNIAFLLWAEVVRWFHQNTSVTMRYMDKTKMFWKLGWQLFGGKFLRFMSGYKNEYQYVSGDIEKGIYNPADSEVNFAVPDSKILRNFKPYGSNFTCKGVRKPGIFEDVIEKISPALLSTSCCLTFDGKKLKQGLTEASGDIDLLGFEEGPSLNDRLSELNSELEKQQNVIDKLKESSETVQERMNVNLKTDLKQKYKLISTYIQEINEIKEKKEYALNKFMERGGKDWRQSKFTYVISAIQAFLFDIQKFISNATDMLEIISRKLVVMQGSQAFYITRPSVDRDDLRNWIEIPEASGEIEDPRKIKQQSTNWFNIRRKAKITGSTIYKAIGLEGLKQQKEHFEKVICGIDEPMPNDFVKNAMEHGSNNEKNAVATLVGKFLPVFMPEFQYQEEGCVVIEDTEGSVFMVVSPDGSLRKATALQSHQKKVEAAIEIKCPVRKVHTRIPDRYYLQCLSEMEALEVEYLIFVSWTENTSNIFKIKRDSRVLAMASKLAYSLYACDKPKRPTKLPEELSEIRKVIKAKIKEVEYLGQFKSLKINTKTNGEDNYSSENVENDTSQLNSVNIYIRISDITRQCYQLKRQKATEALVFLCCDLDRTCSQNQLMWSPVCWCPKGYCLTTNTVRNLMEVVLDKCCKVGIHVPCCSFDGQWHNIAVRSVKGKPLTIIQLQKDVWKETQSLKAGEIQKILKEAENIPQWRWEHRLRKQKGRYVNTQIIICTNGGLRLPETPNKGWPTKSSKKKEQQTEEEALSTIPNLAEIVSENVIDSAIGSSSSTSVLQCNSDLEVAEEIATCNVHEDNWAEILQDMQSEETSKVNSCELRRDAEIDLTEVYKVMVDERNETVEDCVMETEINRKETYQFNAKDYKAIIQLLKSDKDANKTGKWDDKTEFDVERILQNRTSLASVRDVDIRVIVRYLKKVKNFKLKESGTKANKIKAIFEVIDVQTIDLCPVSNNLHTSEKRSLKPVQRLSTLAFKSLKNVPKSVINIACAEYLWPDKLNSWRSHSPIKQNMKIDGLDTSYSWFYVPELVDSRNQLEVRCIDSTHLLTRTRRKTCHGGIEGLDNKPWLKVAKQGKTLLTPVMVEDIVDSMSMSMAVTHFSKPVQNAMRENGDFEAASLCECVMDWWHAEDDPGLDAIERLKLRMKLRRRLLRDVDFGSFPPPGCYVKGWPCQLWEALVAGIDAKAQLYAITKSETYNTRAFSSMMGETFFAELTNQDRGSHGTVTAEDFGRYIYRTIEQMQIRLDQNR
jgi:hypothetical protein